MDSWPELRQMLEWLSSRSDHPLQGYPDPRFDHQPPYHIHLAPWATGIAGHLYERFGDEVDLVVGALHYPEGRVMLPDGREPPHRPKTDYPLLPADQVSVSLGEAVVVESGESVQTQFTIYNHQDSTEGIETNGRITATVIDPETGDEVGGSSGAQMLPLVVFSIAAGESTLVPLLIGTASSVGELGYAIPPGEWAIYARVKLESGEFRTPPLPITIVPRADTPAD